jgi:Ca2+-binding RTX toxin-like protein
MAVNLNTPSEKAAGLYVAYFNRKPDASGLEFWSKKFAEGTGADEAAARFADSDEAQQRFTFLARDLDGEDDSFSEEEAGEVVDQIYQNLLGRAPDDEGRQFWIEQLQSGTDVGQVVIQVLFGAQGEDADLIERAVQTRLQEVEGDRDEGVTVEGDDGKNTLEGSDRDDEISGLAGNDTLRGLAGDDVLNGGDGDDTLNGGPGDDELGLGHGCVGHLRNVMNVGGGLDVQDEQVRRPVPRAGGRRGPTPTRVWGRAGLRLAPRQAPAVHGQT